MNMGWAVALAAAAMLLGRGDPVRAAEPVFTPAACAGDYAGVINKVDCGTLTVDEARGEPGSRRIAIPVAIARATAPRRGLPPVVYLHGGPGGAIVANVPAMLKRPEAREFVAVDQDWIFIDQRGSGGGRPNLDCPGVSLTDAGLFSDRDAAELRACMRRHARGADLSRYNSYEVARDVADLRRALRLPAIDLYGGSYGTRIEAAVLRHAPEGVRSVVQDSPWPPEGAWADMAPRAVADAVDVILAKCSAQPDCARRHPDLAARFDAAARRWLASPQKAAGKTYTADDLGGFLMDTTYSNRGVRSLPADLEKIIAGDLSPVAAFTESRDYYVEGQHMAHLCKEELPFESRAAITRGAGADPVARLLVASLTRLHDVCDGVRVGPARASENQPVRTRVPTLFLAAEIDPGCPPPLTRAAAGGYAGSQVVIVTNATHGVTSHSACARRMVRAFFADPSRPVDRSCLPAAGAALAFIEPEARP
jgi:pimeloyl-ACP methyl ester carboxylesterase